MSVHEVFDLDVLGAVTSKEAVSIKLAVDLEEENLKMASMMSSYTSDPGVYSLTFGSQIQMSAKSDAG